MATISEAVYFCAHFAQSSVKGGREYDEQNGKQGVRTGNRSGHPHGPKRGPSAGAAEALSPAGCGQGRHPADGCGAGAVVPAAGRPDAGRDIPLSGRCLPLPDGTSGGSGGGSTGSNIQKDGMFKLHAYDTCPDLLRTHSRLGYGSLKDIEDDPVRFRICPECQLSPQSMGSVAAASTSIPNGFEYHYRKVAELAREYAEQREELDERSKKLKEEANGLFDSITEAFDEAKTARIKIDPPGKYGAIAFVTTTDPGHTNFLSGFVSGSSSFSKRAAIAGATLLPESTESGKTAINSILDDYASTNAGALVGAERIVLDLWSGLLKGYGEGQDALSNELRSAIDSLPLASESGLGQWAADLFESSLSALGLEPVDLSPQKATLINTAHIMSQDDSNFSLRLLSIKEEVLGAADTDSLFTDALSSAESSITDAIGSAEFTIQVATLKIIEGKVEIPITITLPQSIKDAATGTVQEGFSALKNAIESASPYRRWE